jgi:hypothetical protein
MYGDGTHVDIQHSLQQIDASQLIAWLQLIFKSLILSILSVITYLLTYLRS